MDNIYMVCQVDAALGVDRLDMVPPDELREHVDSTVPDEATTIQILQGVTSSGFTVSSR